MKSFPEEKTCVICHSEKGDRSRFGRREFNTQEGGQERNIGSQDRRKIVSVRGGHASSLSPVSLGKVFWSGRVRSFLSAGCWMA